MEESKIIVGSCMTMCPEQEQIMRKKFNRIHRLEKCPNSQNYKMVKEFSRAAAGKKINASELRPSDVLLKTTLYLVNEVLPSAVEPFHVIYIFVFDRLRAVRQDICMQRLCDENIIIIYGVIVRFLIYAGYRLCEEDHSNFDPTINKSHLQECLKFLLLLFDDINNCNNNNKIIATNSNVTDNVIDDKNNVNNVNFLDTKSGKNNSDLNIIQNHSCHGDVDMKDLKNHEDSDNIINNFTQQFVDILKISDEICRDGKKSATILLPIEERNIEINREIEFVNYYLLLNLGNNDALHFAISRMFKYKHDPSFVKIFELSKSWYTMKNYHKLMMMMTSSPSSSSSPSIVHSLTPLQACLIHMHINDVRLTTLKIMSHSYTSKSTAFPLVELFKMLGFDVDEESKMLRKMLRCCQIDVADDDKVYFNKAGFKMPVKLSPEKNVWVAKLMDNIHIPSLILGHSYIS